MTWFGALFCIGMGYILATLAWWAPWKRPPPFNPELQADIDELLRVGEELRKEAEALRKDLDSKMDER